MGYAAACKIEKIGRFVNTVKGVRKGKMRVLRFVSPLHENVSIMGRTKISEPLPLFWTASGVEIRTDSSELWFELESDYERMEEWIRIEVDVFCMQRMIVPKGRSKICAFRGWPSDTIRTVRLLKEVQPMRGDESRWLLVHGIWCNGELYPVPKRKYRFEFVGDSLTSGVGLAGAPSLKGAGPAVYGLDGHYAIMTADHFDADVRLLAQCGWGVHCSCYNDFIQIMPKYYEQVCGILTGERNRELGALEENDFSAWKPDVIVINLGSNDGFALDREAWVDPDSGAVHRQITNAYGGVEEESALRFEESVLAFLKKLRRLNPEAYLLWAYGMCDHTMRPYLEKAVAVYREKTGDKRADFQILPATNELWVGSDNHPGKKTHLLAAEVLTERIRKILF